MGLKDDEGGHESQQVARPAKQAGAVFGGSQQVGHGKSRKWTPDDTRFGPVFQWTMPHPRQGKRVWSGPDFCYHARYLFSLVLFSMSLLDAVLDSDALVEDRARALCELWEKETPDCSGTARVAWLSGVVGDICRSTLGESSSGKEVLFGILEGLGSYDVRTVVYRAIQDHLTQCHPVAIASRKNNTPRRWKDALANWGPKNPRGFDWAFWNGLLLEEDHFRGEEGLVAFVARNHTQRGWPAGNASPFLPFEQMFEMERTFETGETSFLTGESHQFDKTGQRCNARFRELIGMIGWEDEILVEELVCDQVLQTPERAIEGYRAMAGLPVREGDDGLRAQAWLWTMAHLTPFAAHRWPAALGLLDETLPLDEAVGQIVLWRKGDCPASPLNVLTAQMSDEQNEVFLEFLQSAVIRHRLEGALPLPKGEGSVETPVLPRVRRL
jgi:hypothetical protein